jgi:hypothetical protein
MATNRFVDAVNGRNYHDGATMDSAWKNISYALKSGYLKADYIVWWRRGANEIPGTEVVCVYDGTKEAPIQIIGCPRAQHNISSSDWTNGSDTVTIDDADMSRTKHQSRYIIAPDGHRYFIEQVISSSSILIDREYPGSTVTNNATAYIEEDEDYDIFNAIDDSAWTITKAAWNADADDVPILDFDNGSCHVTVEIGSCHIFKNIEFKDSSCPDGILQIRDASVYTMAKNCLFKQNEADELIIRLSYLLFLEACTIEGSGAGSSQHGISGGQMALKNVAIYNCGGSAIYQPLLVHMDNVSLGQVANGGNDIVDSIQHGPIVGKDVRMGGTNGFVSISPVYNAYPHKMTAIQIENYGKVLGTHRTWYGNAIILDSVAAGAGDPVPAQRSGGAANIMRLQCNTDFTPIEAFAYKATLGEFQMTAAAHTFTFCCQSLVVTTDQQVWIEAEYVDGYDDTSEYHNTLLRSTEHLSVRGDINDWDDYLSVTLTPAVESKVRIFLRFTFYDATATNYIYIDPKCVIS